MVNKKSKKSKKKQNNPDPTKTLLIKEHVDMIMCDG